MIDPGEILLRREAGVATLTINRPQALNALTLENYRRIAAALAEWSADPAVRVVVMRGAGGRAFCAGGDVRALYRAGRGIAGDPSLTAVLFREEYRLIYEIHRLRKPYIAIVDGITMGGGAGISVNGAYRVATERTVFAMPETAIGLFPDVGATRFLNRCPGRIGRYLGLTGARLEAADALYCGLATHFVGYERVDALCAALAGIAWQSGRERDQVVALLGAFAADAGAARLAALRPAIDRCFAADTVTAVIVALAALSATTGPDAEWAAATGEDLAGKSPTSLAVTLRQLILGREFDLAAALTLEYRLTQHFMAAHDFYEGVRALLIDKDQQPRWRPPTLAEVDEATVEAYFLPIGDRELRFAPPSSEEGNR
jgi:enoyl-CoA hydratase